MSRRYIDTVTRGPWNYGGCSGWGINGYQVEPFRIRRKEEWTERGLKFTSRYNFKTQHGQLFGLLLPLDQSHDESTRLGLVYGYIQPYNRNLCQFVQSRAARRRGYISTCPTYLRKAAEHKMG